MPVIAPLLAIRLPQFFTSRPSTKNVQTPGRARPASAARAEPVLSDARATTSGTPTLNVEAARRRTGARWHFGGLSGQNARQLPLFDLPVGHELIIYLDTMLIGILR
jgi:hypothetical protein